MQRFLPIQSSVPMTRQSLRLVPRQGVKEICL